MSAVGSRGFIVCFAAGLIYGNLRWIGLSFVRLSQRGDSHGVQQGGKRRELRVYLYVLLASGSLLRVPAISPGQEATAGLLLPAGGRENLRPKLCKLRKSVEAVGGQFACPN